jgi:hypothetical protein
MLGDLSCPGLRDHGDSEVSLGVILIPRLICEKDESQYLLFTPKACSRVGRMVRQVPRTQD